SSTVPTAGWSRTCRCTTSASPSRTSSSSGTGSTSTSCTGTCPTCTSSGRRPSPLEVPERVDRLAVHANLEVQVRPGRVAGRADVADDLALGDLLPDGDADVRLVAVRG